MLMSDILDTTTLEALQRLDASETELVRALGERIGYGRMMQLAEELWRENLKKVGLEGGEHSIGCCVAFLVPCPGCQPEGPSCDWCHGAKRVTQKVADAIKAEQP